MSKRTTTKKGRSGNPKKAAEQAAAAAVVKNPCLHCGVKPKSRGGIWCLSCADTHRRRGRGNRPSADMIRRTVFGLGEAFGLLDSEGRVIMEDAA